VVSGTITVEVGVTGDATPTKMDLYVGSKTDPTASTTAEPWQVQVDTTALAEGALLFTARVYFSEALYFDASATLLVNNENQNPTASFVSPVNGDHLAGVESIEFTAQDPDGVLDLDSVKLFNGLELLSTFSPNGPFMFDWDVTPYPEGPAQLRVEVKDKSGETGEIELSVIIDNVDDPPTIEILSPNAGAKVMGKFDLGLEIADDRGIDKVEFFVDGALREQLTKEPWLFTWDTTVEETSSHVIMVKVTDSGDQSAEDSITVTKIVALIVASNNYSKGGISIVDYKTGTEVSSWEVSYKCQSVLPIGNAFFFGCGTAGLLMYDLSDAKSPVSLGSYTSEGFYAGNQFVTDDHQYLIVAGTEELRVLKIDGLGTGAPSLSLVNALPSINGAPNAGEGIIVRKGDFLIMPAWDKGVKLFDITDPTQPIESGSWDPPGDDEHINNIALYGDLVYAGEWDTHQNTANIHVINVADGYDPYHMNTISDWMPWNSDYWDFSNAMVSFFSPVLDKQLLFVGVTYSNSSNPAILDLSDPVNPTVLWAPPQNDYWYDVHSFESARLIESYNEQGEIGVQYVYSQVNSDDIALIDVTNPSNVVQWSYYATDEGWINDALVVQ